jgi:hypothetical protein
MTRHRERVEHQELLAGIVAATIANFAGKQLKEDVSIVPADYMPSQSHKRAAQKEREKQLLIADQIRTFFRLHNAAIEERERQKALKEEQHGPSN